MERINWGILGTASIVRKKFLPALEKAENARIYALASRSQERAEKFLQEYASKNREKSYGSYEKLLQDDNIEAIYIPLPNHLHFEWAKKSLQAGKHVLCEKPLVMSVKEGEELFQLAEEQDVFLMEGFMYRFRPLTQRVIELARRELGEIRLVRGSFCYQSTRPAKDIRFRSAAGGGALRDVGCYLVDFISRLFKCRPDLAYNQTVQSARGDVDGQGSAVLVYHGHSEEGTADTDSSLKLDTSTHVNLAYSITIPGSKSLEIVGSEGRLVADEFFDWRTKGSRYIRLEKSSEVNEITLPACDQFKNEIEYFSRMASEWPAGIKEAAISSQESLNNLAILDALEASAQRGQAVEI